ncbi:MAG: AEC family transporter [Desulfurococcaceae archaeon]
MESRIIVFIMLIATGFLLQILSKKLRIERIFSRVINSAFNFVYYVLIPLAFIKTYAERMLSINDLCIVASVLVMVFSIYLSMKIAVRGLDEKLWNSLFITSCFPNAIFLGFPISLIFFGSINVASTYGLVMLILNILVPDFIAIKKIDWKRVLKLPALLGFIIGVSTRLIMKSNVFMIVNTLSWSPTLLSYTATILLGCRLPLKTINLPNKTRFIIIAGIYRFLFAPLISLIVALIFEIDYEVAKQIILVSSMPPAVLNTLVAHRYGWFDELVAYSTVILTFISLALYTAIILLF